MNEDVN